MCCGVALKINEMRRQFEQVVFELFTKEKMLGHGYLAVESIANRHIKNCRELLCLAIIIDLRGVF